MFNIYIIFYSFVQKFVQQIIFFSLLLLKLCFKKCKYFTRVFRNTVFKTGQHCCIYNAVVKCKERQTDNFVMCSSVVYKAHFFSCLNVCLQFIIHFHSFTCIYNKIYAIFSLEAFLHDSFFTIFFSTFCKFPYALLRYAVSQYV